MLNAFTAAGANATEITVSINEFTGENHKPEAVKAFLTKVRSRIANLMTRNYYHNTDSIVKAGEHGIIDESYLFKSNGEEKWIVGVINSHTGDYRIASIPNRSGQAIYLAIRDWIEEDAIICTDGYVAYKE